MNEQTCVCDICGRPMTILIQDDIGPDYDDEIICDECQLFDEED